MKQKFLLDTHVFLWWVLDDPKLHQKHRDILVSCEKEKQAYFLSMMTFWEIAKLVTSGKFQIAWSLKDFFEEVGNYPHLTILPLTHSIILDSVELGYKFPKDPADQIIAATARCHGLHLLTVDRQILSSNIVATL